MGADSDDSEKKRKKKEAITAEKCIMESNSSNGIEAFATITIKITHAPPLHTTLHRWMNLGYCFRK